MLLTFAVPALAADKTKLVVNGKTVSGVEFKTIKGIIYIPLKNTKTIFGVSSSFHKESNTVVVGTGIDVAKKQKRATTTRLIVNGKITTGVNISTLNNTPYVPLLKLAPTLSATASWKDQTKTVTITLKSSTSSTAGTVGLESMKIALSKYGKGVSLTSASSKIITQYQNQFFSKSRTPLSLDKIAKAVAQGEIAKDVTKFQSSIVNLTFVDIDQITETKLSNGQTVTHAIGHTGGKYNEMTESWVDSTYYQIFYLGSTKIFKGSGTTVNGVPIGKSTIDLVSNVGVEYTAPMYVVVAGNFLNSIDEYDIRKEASDNNTGPILFPDELSDAQKALEKLSVTMSDGKLKILDEWGVDLKIKSIQVMDYEYAISSPISLPNKYEGGLSIELDSLKNSNGESFAPVNGVVYFIKIVTDAGEVIRSESLS
nr:stalk domain-containing protein [Cohnella sp. WQ 127256]